MRSFFNKFGLFIVLFIYIFAFYIYISVSILIAVPFVVFAFFRKEYLKQIIYVVNSHLIIKVFIMCSLLVFLSFFISVFYGTYDYSLAQIFLTQYIHLFCAVPVLAFLRYKNFDRQTILKYFVYILCLQTIIQIIVLMSPSLLDIVRFSNRFEPDKVLGPGSNIRGMALSAATTYHLSLVYGIAFIIYIKEFLSKSVSMYNIMIGILLFGGIFFSGRTGFVGVGVGILFYLLSNKTALISKIKLFFYIPILIIILSLIISKLSPEFETILNKDILPYAFEFYYNLDSTGEAETQSTNELLDMWKKDFNPFEIVFGSGKYTNPDSSYYMRVDAGILRACLFMGIWGYVILIFYQYSFFPIFSFDKKQRYFYYAIFLYLFFMDLKGGTIGINKFVFSTCLLLSFSNLYLKDEK